MSSYRRTLLGTPAQPSCIAAPVRPLALVQSNDCTPSHAHARLHALPLGPSPQSPPGIRGPPKSHARRRPTNIPPGTPPRSAASPVALRPVRPPDSNSSFRHPKRSTAIARVLPDLPDVLAARSVAPRTLPGTRGQPKFHADRNPTKRPPRKGHRCAAGSDPHPPAYRPRSSAALRHPTSSARSIRLPGFPPGVQTPPGSKRGIHGPPRFHYRHIPTNIPGGTPHRSSVFPAPRPLACSRDNTAAARHLKSREPASRPRIGPAPSLFLPTHTPLHTAQLAFSNFAC